MKDEELNQKIGRTMSVILILSPEKIKTHLCKIKGVILTGDGMLRPIVKPKSEVPKSKVPKSRPKGLGLTLKSHGPCGHPPHGRLHIT